MGLFGRRRKAAKKDTEEAPSRSRLSGSPGQSGQNEYEWHKSLEDNLQVIRDAFGSPDTVKLQRLEVAGRDAAIVFASGLVDLQKIAGQIMQPLADWSRAHPETRPELHDWRQGVLAAAQTSTVRDLSQAALELFSGSAPQSPTASSWVRRCWSHLAVRPPPCSAPSASSWRSGLSPCPSRWPSGSPT
ncbi:MAG: spore germination protein [Bacillota bacterium]